MPSAISIFYVWPPKGGLLFGRLWVLTFVISIGFLCKDFFSEIHKERRLRRNETVEEKSYPASNRSLLLG